MISYGRKPSIEADFYFHLRYSFLSQSYSADPHPRFICFCPGCQLPGVFSAWSRTCSILIDKIIIPCLDYFSFKTRIIWIGLCMMAGFALVYTIPITVSYKIQSIHIIATGEKNPFSKGNEVWLASISGSRRAPVTTLSRICHGNWLVKENMLVFTHNRPSNLVCNIRTDDRSIFVTLGMHPWSGKAHLNFKDQEIEVDLYAENSGVKGSSVQTPIRQTEAWLSGSLVLANGFCLGLFLLSLSFAL